MNKYIQQKHDIPQSCFEIKFIPRNDKITRMIGWTPIRKVKKYYNDQKRKKVSFSQNDEVLGYHGEDFPLLPKQTQIQ